MLARVNSVALITGSSRGIGRGIALELARLGWDLTINYRSNELSARQTADACLAAAKTHHQTIRCEICQADIAENTDRQSLIEFVKSRFGRLDLLVNNAGVAPEVRTDVLHTTEASFDRVLNINVKGPYFLTQLAARWMVERMTESKSESPYKPKIITVSSISAYTASPNRGE